MPTPLDLTGEEVSSTYQRLVQTDSGFFYDGLGATLNIGAGATGAVGPTGPTGTSAGNGYFPGGW